MKVSLLSALESASARADQLGARLLAFGRAIPFEEIERKIEEITLESVRAAGRRLVGSGRPTFVAWARREASNARRCGRSIAPQGRLKQGAGMAFFKSLGISASTPVIDGSGVSCGCRAWPISRNGRLARRKPRLSGALGAGLAGRRSHPRRLSPPPPPLRARPARGKRLRVSGLPEKRSHDARRATLTNLRRARAGGKPRLLDGQALCRKRLYERRNRGTTAICAFDAAALAHRSCVPAFEFSFDPSARKNELHPRGHGAAVSVDCRKLAGSLALRASCERSAAAAGPTKD